MATRRLMYVVFVGVILALVVAACTSAAPPAPQAKPATSTEAKPAAAEKPAAAKPAQPAAAKSTKIVLSAVSFLPKDNPGLVSYVYLVNEINKRSNGELTIDWKGGPEVIGGFEQFEAVKSGAVDLIFNTDSYAKGTAPELEFSAFSKFDPPKEREIGIWDFWNRIYREKLNAYYLGHPHGGLVATTHIFTNKRVDNPAGLNGQKIRSVPMYEAFLKSLNMTPVTLPVPEIYTAMDRKTIDGFALPMFSGVQTAMKLAEVTKYVIEPGFLHPDQNLLLNLAKWNQLPKHLQDLLVEVTKDTEIRARDSYAKLHEQEVKASQQAKMEVIKFSQTDSQQFLGTLDKAVRESMVKELGADKGNELYKLLTEGKK